METNQPSHGGTDARKGWIVAVATLIALIPSSASIMLYGQGYFIGPMTAEFGWTRTQFMFAVSLSIAALTMVYPLAGYWGDRYGVRPVLLVGVVLFGLGTIATSLLSGSLLAFTLLTILVGMTAVVQSPLLYSKAIASWAPQRIRGRTLAVGVSGIPVGNFVVPLVAIWLISHYGWRGGRIGLGVMILAVTLPMILLFIREPARNRARGATHDTGLWRGLAALARNRTCWLLVIALLAGGVALNGLLSNLIPILTDRGFTLGEATAHLSVMAVASATGRLGSGWLLDRFQFPRIGLLWFILGMIGMVLAGIGGGMTITMLAVALVGLSVGAEVELAGYYASRYFPLSRFGESYGVLSASYSLGTAIGSLLFSVSFDAAGSYLPALIMAIAMLGVSSAAILALPAYPAEADKGW